jgi:serine/threonine-protein kinase
MEFLDGESLAARLRRTGLAFTETMHVIAQCCSALSASHAKGIVHRDLKPENIYLCPRGPDKNFVKILDFGIAKLTGDGGQSHKTRTGLVIGTPTYMSPEQCEGKGHIDARSDVYSLGVVMYELLTGRVPFPGDGFGEILVAHLTKQPDPPSSLNPDITPDIEAIVMHAIEKDRNRRFQSMDEFAEAVANTGAHRASYSALPAYTPGGTGAMPIARATGALAIPNSAAGPVGPMTAVGQRPTTLSGAASELDADGGAKKNKMPLMIAGGAGAAVVIGGLIALLSGGKPKPPVPVAPPVAAVAQPTKAADTTLTVLVTSEPPGATVLRGGTSLGTTPFELKVKRDSPEFEVQVKKDGYAPQLKLIQTERSREVTVLLVKESAPTAAATPTAAAPVKHHSSTRPKSSGSDSGNDNRILMPKF